METLAHLFFPRVSNNHKAKILHPSSLLTIAILFGIFQFALRAVPFSHQGVLGYAAQISPSEVIRLTNEKRAAAGLSPVTFNQTLTDAAKEKGQYMIDHDFWAHVAPDGTEPWFFFQKHGYKYRYAGENLARDFSNPSSAVDAWMASPSHRDNMLSAKYKDIGVAVVEGDLSGDDATIIVQLFGTTLSDSQSIPIAKAQTNVSPTTEPVKGAVNSVTVTMTPILTPTPVVTEVVVQTASEKIVSDQAQNTESSGVPLFLSQFETTRGISLTILGLLAIITMVDGLIIAGKHIKRKSGRTFAHLLFFGMIIVVILLIQSGKIL